MRNIKYPLIIIHIITPLIFTVTSYALSQTTQKMVVGDKSQSIEINSDSFEIDNKRHSVTFTGNVEALRDDLNIKCEKIVLFYEDPTGDNNFGEGGVEILELIATKNVILSRADGSTATGEKAVYNKNDEEVVLTGDPAVVKRGDDYLAEGEKITYYLEEDRFVADGRARAIWSPKEDER